MKIDDLQVGKVVNNFHLRIGSDDVSAYLLATGDDSSVWRTEKLVPPQMIVTEIIGKILEVLALPKNLVHTGQEHIANARVSFDTALRITATVSQLSERAGTSIVVFDSQVTDSQGNMCLESKTKVMVLGGDTRD